ncbi:MAG: Mov34/MPN/PAD-1 family protein [Chthoniobacteraceae bacterium]
MIRDVQSGDTRTIISTWGGDGKAECPETHAVQVVVFKTPPQPHGIVRRAPKNLAELDALTSAAGLPLIRQLWQKLATWHTAGVLAQVAKRELLLMLELPKTRSNAGSAETHEYRAFLLGKNVHQVAHLLGVLSRKPGKTTTDFKIPAGVPEQLKVQICQTHCSLSATVAAEMNGVPSCDRFVAAIGAGALGSQVVINLARAGWGGWAVIDPDVLFPHNLARHALDGYSVGFYKTAGLAHAVDSLYPNVRRILGVPDDVLSPKLPTTNEFLAKAELILDFSASVPVARHLARQKDHARTLSAFVSPKGDCFVLLVEDGERQVRLDWLEMLHYRAVLNDAALGETLQLRDQRYRYGGGCRDISAVLAQEDLALWAGAAARAIRKCEECADAAVRIYVRHDDGSVTVHIGAVTAPKQIPLTDAETSLRWTIQLDQWLLEKLARHRRERLPNETGGILLGNFDTQAKVCSIVDMIASPPDSVEWPTSYIRGCEGLTAAVQEVQRKTAHQLTYVGEWHSHPDRCGTRPSGDDLQAYAWLLAQMKLEALPAVMLIIGEGGEYRLVATI